MKCIACLSYVERKLQSSVHAAHYVLDGKSLCSEHARQELRAEQ